ncbi:Uncharacterised protein [Mycobacteroides abscessus subsp. abscessus]|nr:Uncharacterised protein [Mycobacteroides abscessus subsp. abscessus]
MIAGFFCRRLPAALLRGFANGGLLSSTREAFSASKSSSRKNTSPRTSRSAGIGYFSDFVSLSGTSSMVRAFRVTSSPLRPSPRVAPRTSTPFSYTSESATPSIFNSHRYSGSSPISPRTRASQAVNSSELNALSKLSIRSR